VGTEGQGSEIARNDGLKFKIGEIGVDSFLMKIVATVRTMEQTKTVFSIKE
jgi:hypothetical protein